MSEAADRNRSQAKARLTRASQRRLSQPLASHEHKDDSDMVSSEDGASFQSPRKRVARVTTERRKKARPEVSQAPDAAPREAPLRTAVVPTSAAPHRYPLRSHGGGGQVRTASNHEDALLPSAVTPASAAAPRQLHFSVARSQNSPPALYAYGTPTCQCPHPSSSPKELVAFAYLKCYGEGFLDYLHERESQSRSVPRPPTSLSMASLATAQPGNSNQESSSSMTLSSQVSDDSSSSPLGRSNFLSPPTTPRPDSVISTKARTQQGERTMRFLERPRDKLLTQPYVTERMRAVLISWLVEVSTEYNCSTAAYHLAISLLDQVLACGPTRNQLLNWLEWSDEIAGDDEDCDYEEPDWKPEWFVVLRKHFQALGWYVSRLVPLRTSFLVPLCARGYWIRFSHAPSFLSWHSACLWIASKMEDRDPPLMEDFFYISDQSVTTLSLRVMERRVCKALQFRVHALTPMHYLPTFLRASRPCQDAACPYRSTVQHNVALYLITLGRISYDMSKMPPSVLTAAAVYLARVTLGIQADERIAEGVYWSSTLSHYTGYRLPELKTAVFMLYNYQLKAEEMNIAVYHHFAKIKFDKASLRTAPRLELLDFDSPIRYDFLAVSEDF